MDSKILEFIADTTGLTYDGGNDTRLFHSEMHHVYASVMTEREYNKMERSLSKTIKGKGYTVYAWNDSSGYKYWNNDSDANYIQITVDVQDLNKIDIKKLQSDVNKLFDHLEKYDNSEEFYNKKMGY